MGLGWRRAGGALSGGYGQRTNEELGARIFGPRLNHSLIMEHASLTGYSTNCPGSITP